MTRGRILTGALAGGGVMLGLGYMLWDVLFASIFAEWSEGDVTNWWWVAVGSLIMGAVLTLWLLKSNSMGWRGGVRHGASIGFMIWLGVNILYFGWDGGSLRLHLIDSVIEGIRWGGAGGVVGLILGSKSVRARVGE